jgi:hypothetical protein
MNAGHRFSMGPLLRSRSNSKLVRSLLFLVTSTILATRCYVCSRNRGSGRHWNGETPRHSSSALSPSQLTFFFCFLAAALPAGADDDAEVVFVAVAFFLCSVLLLGLGVRGVYAPISCYCCFPLFLSSCPLTSHLCCRTRDGVWRKPRRMAQMKVYL